VSKNKPSKKQAPLLPASGWFLAWLILQPRRWNLLIPLKHQLIFNGLHGVIFQKIEFVAIHFDIWLGTNVMVTSLIHMMCIFVTLCDVWKIFNVTI
jgi:hypothetical protein